jgi:hypothetical protein
MQDFWIEFSQVGEYVAGNTISKRSWYDLWDFTVKDALNNEKTGRLFSKSWSFSGGGWPSKFSKNFILYPLAPDPNSPGKFYVKKWELAGIDPFGVNFRCNDFGNSTAVGTSYLDRRKSQQGNVDNGYPQHRIFVNPPDAVAFPSGSAPYYRSSMESYCNKTKTGGSATITYYVTEPGYGDIN